MKFELRIDTDSAAITDDRDEAMQRILDDLSLRFYGHRVEQTDAGVIRDVNGNAIGTWTISP